MQISVTVRDLMNAEPLAIDQKMSIADVTRVVLDQVVHEAYVVDSDRRLLGVVADYELLKANLLDAERDQPVSRIMSRSLMVIGAKMTLWEVAGMFRESTHSRVAVVEDGQLVGQLSRRDVLRTIVVLNDLEATSFATPVTIPNSTPIRSSFRRIEEAEAETPRRPATMDQRMAHGSSRSSMIEGR